MKLVLTATKPYILVFIGGLQLHTACSTYCRRILMLMSFHKRSCLVRACPNRCYADGCFTVLAQDAL